MHNNVGDIFSHIYDNGVWGVGAGPGSYMENNLEYMQFLTSIIKKYDVASVLDYGCGDWQFSKSMGYSSLVDSYLGVDVVSGVIDTNNKTYASDNVKFQLIGQTFEFGTYDLIICKDVMQHTPNWYAANLLKSFKAHSKYCILTNDIVCRPESGLDCDFGGYRTINLLDEHWAQKSIDDFYWYHKDGIVKQTVVLRGDL